MSTGFNVETSTFCGGNDIPAILLAPIGVDFNVLVNVGTANGDCFTVVDANDAGFVPVNELTAILSSGDTIFPKVLVGVIPNC